MNKVPTKVPLEFSSFVSSPFFGFTTRKQENILRTALNTEASLNMLLSQSVHDFFNDRSYDIMFLYELGTVVKLYSEFTRGV